MGAFVLFFVIRMAGAIMEQNETAMEQKEEAETTLRLSEDRFRSLIQNSSDVTMILGDMGVFRYVSPAIKDLLQYEPDELIGRLSTDFVHPEDLDAVLKMLGGGEFQAGPGTATLEFRMLRQDGTTRDVEAVVSNQTDRPSVAGYVSNIRDVTERKKFEALLAFRALHDPLTGLANRQLILDRAQQMLVRARRSGVPVAALFIDLDNFKDSNDSLGHGAGDKLLQMVAGRLLGILRSGDTVGRLGRGRVRHSGRGRLLRPRTRDDRRAGARGAQAGLPPSGDRRHVDHGLGQHRDRRGRPPVGRGPAARRRHRALPGQGGGSRPVRPLRALHAVGGQGTACLKSDLETALEDDEFSLLYHPIFDLDGIEIQGVEALLRWEHPTKGTITPDVFIPVLEETRPHHRRRPLGAQRVLPGGRRPGSGRGTGPAFRSTSPCASSSPTSSSTTSATRCVASGLDPAMLILEVTESTLMRDSVATVARLNRLKRLGVKVAIDDFGTGYSSLAYLRQFPVDVLKIDRSFVADMSRSPDAAALIHTLIELGRTLGLVTLAEGIETHEQLEGLRGRSAATTARGSSSPAR